MISPHKRRSLSRYICAIFNRNHWITLFKVFIVIVNPLIYMRLYIFSEDRYPCTFGIRTPVGVFNVEAQRFEDIFTINEIFIWEVYRSTATNVFIDIGGNIGLASLYFLTRTENSCGILIEPLPSNFVRAQDLLFPFKSRILLLNLAVAEKDGKLLIGVEKTGRYSGVDCVNGDPVEFSAIGINTLLEKAIDDFGCVGLVKVDCEGAEKRFLAEILPGNLAKVSEFVIESASFNDAILKDAGFSKIIVYDDGENGGVFKYIRSDQEISGCNSNFHLRALSDSSTI